MGQTSHGRSQQPKLSTSTSVGHKSFYKALGMARGKISHVETWQRDSTNNVYGKLGQAFDKAKPRRIARIMESHNIHGWLIAALLREESDVRLRRKLFPFQSMSASRKRKKFFSCGKRLLRNSLLPWRESGHSKTWASCWTSKERRRIRHAVSCPTPKETWNRCYAT